MSLGLWTQVFCEYHNKSIYYLLKFKQKLRYHKFIRRRKKVIRRKVYGFRRKVFENRNIIHSLVVEIIETPIVMRTIILEALREQLNRLLAEANANTQKQIHDTDLDRKLQRVMSAIISIEDREQL